MAIIFSNGMNIDTSVSGGVTFYTSSNTVISTIGTLGTSQPGIPYADVYWNGNSYGDQSAAPSKCYPGETGNQSFWPSAVPGNQPYAWNSKYFNRRTSEFVCPVPGRYRMSCNYLNTGTPYNRNGCHVYALKNGVGIGVNGAHMVGGMNYGTVHSIVVVTANAGDRLSWAANEGLYRSYSGGWSNFTYCLLP
jgi:hypothetical protein